MKRITALLHAHRMSDIVHALEAAGERRLSVVQARGLLRASSAREQDYSVELGERVTQEIQLDVFCEDERVDAIIALIRQHGRTGQVNAGWIFTSSIDDVLLIDRADVPA
ncbi:MULTISPECIES: P-II family nitrogen regulator [Arenimonas]|jgi:nitrogen regulatory protein P-II 1|uniref:P-II family nitrogen regulator n=1 Tax=Arenimonas TaxID=490567 RepID=UPI0011BF62BA|nr:P-II family nitrogen regulator [Arenimonas daejeonensis]